LDISSTPAREALHTLRAEGFLELAPRRGFTVAPLTGDDIRDVFLVQSIVAGELAARAATKQNPGLLQLLQRLEAVHVELTAAAERADFAALEALNHQFHREINLAASAPKLAWLIQLASRYAPRRFYATIEGWPESTIHDHAGLLDAFRAADAERARGEMSGHVMRAGDLLARHIDARFEGIEGTLPA
jgi:DNA-binding GntR family transcriptional regulator